jgi:acyl-CoA hydrolase
MKTPNHQLTMSVLMTPDKANLVGNVHGGDLLHLLDQVAYSCASRYCGRYVVTMTVDQVVFRQPIHVGELVTCLASVNSTGRTSMEVGIKVVAENIHTKVVRHANSCYFTMVAIDENGRPTAVPRFEPTGAEEERRHQAASLRQRLRRELEKQHRAILTHTAQATPEASDVPGTAGLASTR